MERTKRTSSNVGNAEQVLSLLRSHARRDETRFLSVALQIADDAARKGHRKVADEMHAVISEAKAASSALTLRADNSAIPIAKPRGELAGIVAASFPKTVLADLVLSPDLTRKLRKIMRECGARQELDKFGLSPRRKFLLSGPSGTGKTMSAAAIAGELNLPLFTIQLDGLFTKYMGETAAKLRLVFDAMATTRGVYFFDEVDALAGARGSGTDVGEARRILNSLLQFLEDDRSTSLVFAATNHPELLDRAVFRRFDSQLRYELPDSSLVRPLLENSLLAFDLSEIDWHQLSSAASGLSQADLARAADDAAREAVLEHKGILTTSLLVDAINDRKRT